MSKRKEPGSFPTEKMWAFRTYTFQIRMYLSYFHFYQIRNEYMNAYGAFASILLALMEDPHNRIPIDKQKAAKFLDYFYGEDPDSKNALKRGLYALDVVQRDFEDGTHTVLLRGYGAEQIPDPRRPGRKRWIPSYTSPNSHHKTQMILFKRMYPLMMQLWHQIIEKLEGFTTKPIPDKWVQAAKELREELAQQRDQQEQPPKEEIIPETESLMDQRIRAYNAGRLDEWIAEQEKISPTEQEMTETPGE